MSVATESNSPLLERILNRVLQCSHRQLGRPITLNGESFAVCLGCGRRIAYDLAAFRTGSGRITGSPKDFGVPEPGKSGRERSDARARWPVARKPAAWASAVAAVLAAGFFLSTNRMPREHVSSRPARHRTRAPERTATASSPTAAPRSLNEVQPPVVRVSDPVPRLEGDGRVTVLARDVAAGLEVSHHPGRLNELIRRGSLFTVRSGTAVRVRDRKKTIVRVVVLSGPMSGQQGWAQASEVRW